MADVRTATKTATEEPRVARNAEGREMSALSYTAIYRQKLKEEQVRKISESKLRIEDDADAEAKAKQREARRLAMEEKLRQEREAVAARNALADAVLSDISARQADKESLQQAQSQPTPAPAPEEPAAPAPAPTPIVEKQTPVAPTAPTRADAIAIPAPVLRRVPVEQPAPAPAPAPKPAVSIPMARPHTPAYEAPVSCKVQIKGGEMQMVADPYDDASFTVVPMDEDDGDVVIITGDETDAVSLNREDGDIVYFDENGQIIDDTVPPVVPQATEDAEPMPEPIEPEPVEEPVVGEPPMPEVPVERHVAKKAKRADKRAAKKANRGGKLSREEQAARLADEAVRAALARDEAVARMAKSNAEEKATLAAAQAAVEEAARMVEHQKAQADAEAQAKIYEENESRDARIRQLEQARAAEELAEAEAELASKKEQLDAEARKQARLAAVRAERASERDREAAERAEEAALQRADIKDWRYDVRTEPVKEPTEDETEELPPMGPRRVEPRRPSYSRAERKALAAEAEKKLHDDIAAELSLWNEEDIEEAAYAVLPEGVDDMDRRELRRLFKDETRRFEQYDRTCEKTLKLLKKAKPSWITVRAGFEALVAEKTFIESLARAVKLARLAKRKGHIRSLCDRLEQEIAREAKMLRRMKGLSGFAPQATDPMMPKALKKQRPYKIPTALYRIQQPSEA